MHRILMRRHSDGGPAVEGEPQGDPTDLPESAAPDDDDDFGVLPGGENDLKYEDGQGDQDPEEDPAGEGDPVVEDPTKGEGGEEKDIPVIINADGTFDQPFLGKYQSVKQALDALQGSQALTGKHATELEQLRKAQTQQADEIVGDDTAAELVALYRDDPRKLMDRLAEEVKSAEEKRLDAQVRQATDPEGFAKETARAAVHEIIEQKARVDNYNRQIRSFYDGTLGDGNWDAGAAGRLAVRRDFFGYDNAQGVKVPARGGLDELLHLAWIGRNVRDGKMAPRDPATQQKPLVIGPRGGSGSLSLPANRPAPKKGEMSEEEAMEKMLDDLDENFDD